MRKPTTAALTRKLATQIPSRAHSLCEYFQLPRSHVGTGNLKNGPNLIGVDPDSGAVVSLFHPRTDRWTDHFDLDTVMGNPPQIYMKGLTSKERSTIHVLGMNEQMRRVLRFELWREGLFA